MVTASARAAERVITLVLLGVVGVMPVGAATKTPTPKPAVWKQEPTGFHGVELGKPYSGTGYCKGTSCYDALILPELDVDQIEVVSMLKNGIVEDIYFGFKAKDWDKMTELFQKYGPPSAVTHIPVGNLLGYTTANEQLIWKGKVVQFYLQRYLKTLDQSFAEITTLKHAADERAKTEADKKGVLDRF